MSYIIHIIVFNSSSKVRNLKFEFALIIELWKFWK